MSDDPPRTSRTGMMLGSWPTGMPRMGRFYVDLARRVEALGYDLLFTGDHIFMYSPNADPLVVLATWAGVTERVTIGTAVLLLPLREPVVTGKQLATIDYLSGGRLVVGVGVGGEIEQEWRAMEVPTDSRGRRLDEYIELLRELWSGDPVHHTGEFRTVTGVTASPTPKQPGGPPLWVGGRSDAALSRASRHQGWCGYAVSPDRVRRSLARIREFAGDVSLADFRTSYVLFTHVDDDTDRARAIAGEVLGTRYRQDFGTFLDRFCAVGDPEHVRARVAEYRAAGVDDVILCPQAPTEQYIDQVEHLAEVLGVAPPH